MTLTWVERTGSTNADLRALALEGAPHGTAIAARMQTAGRGRLGRLWQSEPGNLFVSVLSRTPLRPGRVPLAALASGVGVAVACGGGTRLKWPNDVLAPDGRKVAGLLAERDPDGRWLVVGAGVNVVSAPPGLPATCLADIGAQRPLEELAADVVRTVLAEIELLSSDPEAVLNRWRARSQTLGRRVLVHDVAGTAVDIAADGALLVRTDAGEIRRILAGDVAMVRTGSRSEST